MTSQAAPLRMQSPPRDTRKRIILVTPDIVGPVKNGGIGTACFHYARSLANAGYQVEVLFSDRVGEVERQRWAAWYDALRIGFHTLDEIPPIGITVHGWRWHVERAHYILQYLRERHYDYIIFQDWHANGFWAARAKQMGVAFADTPIAVICHSPTQWQKQGMQTFGSPVEDCSLEWAEKETIAAVDILITPSHHMVDWLFAHGYRLPQRVDICPYTFEDETFKAPADADVGHLIFFGRLETRKGLHLLAGALRELQARGGVLPRRVSWLGKLAKVNGIPTMDYLQALERDLGSVEFVVMTDFDYAQAIEYIRSQNGIVVIPSTLDNYPLTVIESIANGFRFIASDAGGIPEMIDPAVGFERTVSGLRKKLEGLSSIDFAGLRHAYHPENARRSWLEHVDATLATARRPPDVPRAHRSPVPPVSVCVPFYRHDQYVDRLVYSFLRMDLPELQLVFVNDGTPPEERKHFDKLRRELEPLGHVFHDQVNAGPGLARNKAVELAKHDLLLFFDADNVPFPGMVKRLCSALISGSADSVAAPFVGVRPMLRLPVSEDAVMQYRPPGGPVALALIDNVVGDVCSLVRRQVFDAVGGFSEQRQTWEDLDFLLRAIARGFRHLVYPDPLFFYTVDVQGRRLTASHMYHRNLLRCLYSMPAEVTSEVAEIFAMQFLVSRRR